MHILRQLSIQVESLEQSSNLPNDPSFKSGSISGSSCLNLYGACPISDSSVLKPKGSTKSQMREKTEYARSSCSKSSRVI